MPPPMIRTGTCVSEDMVGGIESGRYKFYDRERKKRMISRSYSDLWEISKEQDLANEEMKPTFLIVAEY